ncbi:hypothetical protein VSR82_07775 [Burkholderia sp. JPY481]
MKHGFLEAARNMGINQAGQSLGQADLGANQLVQRQPEVERCRHSIREPAEEPRMRDPESR